MSEKTTLVIGASDNPARYSNMAINKLRMHKHPVVAIGKKAGTVGDITVETQPRNIKNIDTVTLYLNPVNQEQYYKYILDLNPKRIIFNPGAENAELERLAAEKGIEPIEACTLVLLSTGQY